MYIEGASPGSLGGEDTWVSYENPFTLYVVGAYGPNTQSIEGVTLLVSVPEGETGTLSIYLQEDPSEEPPLLTQEGEGSPSPYTNPTANANTEILTNISGYTGYSELNFLPDGLNLNSHYPLKNEVSNFLLFSLGNFSNSESGLYNYNASNGSIEQTNASGEQKEYVISYSGFSWLHFDVYGLVTDTQGKKKIVTTWDNNPGSHDATAVVPEPATLLLFGTGLTGLGLIGWRRRKR